jgi:hypothetical protein
MAVTPGHWVERRHLCSMGPMPSNPFVPKHFAGGRFAGFPAEGWGSCMSRRDKGWPASIDVAEEAGGITEIAKTLGIDRASVHRALQARH